MAVWMKLPMPTKYGHCRYGQGPLLALKNGAFISGSGDAAHTFCTMDPLPDGWHHVAVALIDRSYRFSLMAS